MIGMNSSNRQGLSVMKNNLEKLKHLFWDYEWDSVIENLNSHFVIARVLELGDKEEFKILRSVVKDESIINFLKSEKAQRLLSKQSLNFWKIYYGIEK
jgi:hypothetical protein